MSSPTLFASELNFPDGLVGCPEWRRFTLRALDETGPVRLLVSTNMPELSFPVVNPWLVIPAYAPSLTEADRAALGVTDDAELDWLTVLTVESEPFKVTANLLGPLVFHRRTGAARQVILSQSGYSAAHPVGGTMTNSEVAHAGAHAEA